VAHPTGRTVPTTIYSVAERAGVSIATVSRVLQGPSVVTPATRQRVLEAVEGLGYVPLAAALALYSSDPNHTDYGLLLAGATTVILPVLVVFLIFQRRFIEGVASTGIK
jgi:DNA-binding LacI/PurR family transcriptional regulator